MKSLNHKQTAGKSNERNRLHCKRCKNTDGRIARLFFQHVRGGTRLSRYRGNAEPKLYEEKEVQEVIMGCVLPGGLRQGPARQAAIQAGIPVETGASTINKLCGSGMKATMLAFDSIKSRFKPACDSWRYGKYVKCAIFVTEGSSRPKDGAW